MDTELRRKLAQAARTAAAHAYNPYSGFSVGAAVVDTHGRTFSGCNIENASYGLTCCAERAALFSAVSAGAKPGEIQGMVIYVPGDQAHASCGACRQVMLELMEPSAPVVSCCDGTGEVSGTVSELLPTPFELRPPKS